MRSFDDFLSKTLCASGDGGGDGGGSSGSSDYNESQMGSGAGAGNFNSANGPGGSQSGSADETESNMYGAYKQQEAQDFADLNESAQNNPQYYADTFQGPKAGGAFANFASNPLSFMVDKVTANPLSMVTNGLFGLAMGPFGMMNTAMGMMGAPTVGSAVSGLFGNPGGMQAMGAGSHPSGATARGDVMAQDPQDVAVSKDPLYRDSGVSLVSQPSFAEPQQIAAAQSTPFHFVRFPG